MAMSRRVRIILRFAVVAAVAASVLFYLVWNAPLPDLPLCPKLFDCTARDLRTSISLAPGADFILLITGPRQYDEKFSGVITFQQRGRLVVAVRFGSDFELSDNRIAGGDLIVTSLDGSKPGLLTLLKGGDSYDIAVHFNTMPPKNSALYLYYDGYTYVRDLAKHAENRPSGSNSR